MHFGHWNFFALMRAKIPLSQKRLSKNCGIVKIVSMMKSAIEQVVQVERSHSKREWLEEVKN